MTQISLVLILGKFLILMYQWVQKCDWEKVSNGGCVNCLLQVGCHLLSGSELYLRSGVCTLDICSEIFEVLDSNVFSTYLTRKIIISLGTTVSVPKMYFFRLSRDTDVLDNCFIQKEITQMR